MVTKTDYDVLGRPVAVEMTANAAASIGPLLKLKTYKTYTYVDAADAVIGGLLSHRKVVNTYYQLGSSNQDYREQVEVVFEDGYGRVVEHDVLSGIAYETTSYLYSANPPEQVSMMTEIQADGASIFYQTNSDGSQVVTSDSDFDVLRIERHPDGRIKKESFVVSGASTEYEYDGDFVSRMKGVDADGVYFDDKNRFSDSGKIVGTTSYRDPGSQLSVGEMTQSWNGREVTRDRGAGIPKERESLDSYGNRVRLFVDDGNGSGFVSDRILRWEYDASGVLLDVLLDTQWTFGPNYDDPGEASHGNPIYRERITPGLREQRVYYGYTSQGAESYVFDSNVFRRTIGTGVAVPLFLLQRIDASCDTTEQPRRNFVSTYSRYRHCFGRAKGALEASTVFVDSKYCKENDQFQLLQVPSTSTNCHERRIAESEKWRIKNEKGLQVRNVVDLVVSGGSSALIKGLFKGGAKVASVSSKSGLNKLPKSIRDIFRKCFAAGTLVETIDGLMPIERIEVGDLVWSRDDSTGDESFQPVLETFETPNNEVFEIRLVDDEDLETVLTVTPGHPFWVKDRGWVASDLLRKDDAIYSSHGGWLRVSSSTWAQTTKATTYNFEVANSHTYFVGKGRAWVHNTGDCFGVLRAQVRSLKRLGVGADKVGRRAGAQARRAFIKGEEVTFSFATRGGDPLVGVASRTSFGVSAGIIDVNNLAGGGGSAIFRFVSSTKQVAKAFGGTHAEIFGASIYNASLPTLLSNRGFVSASRLSHTAFGPVEVMEILTKTFLLK